VVNAATLHKKVLDFSGEQAIRTGMIREIGWFNPNLTMVSDALERLGATPRPFTNAVL
jgi:hypothetical protein